MGDKGGKSNPIKYRRLLPDRKNFNSSAKSALAFWMWEKQIGYIDICSCTVVAKPHLPLRTSTWPSASSWFPQCVKVSKMKLDIGWYILYGFPNKDFIGVEALFWRYTFSGYRSNACRCLSTAFLRVFLLLFALSFLPFHPGTTLWPAK